MSVLASVSSAVISQYPLSPLTVKVPRPCYAAAVMRTASTLSTENSMPSGTASHSRVP